MKGHAQKETFLGLLRVWYADENALVRQKLHAARIKRITPWLSEIIRQGLEEGIVTTGYPDKVGHLVVSLLNDHGNTLAELLLAGQFRPEHFVHIERTVAAYTDALERVLGIAHHSLLAVRGSDRRSSPWEASIPHVCYQLKMKWLQERCNTRVVQAEKPGGMMFRHNIHHCIRTRNIRTPLDHAFQDIGEHQDASRSRCANKGECPADGFLPEILRHTPSQTKTTGLQGSKAVPVKTASSLSVSKSMGRKVTCSGNRPKCL